MSHRDLNSAASQILTPPADAVPAQPHPEAPAPGTVLGPHFVHCFGCGPTHRCGLHLQFVVGEGVSVSARLRMSQDHAGYHGLAHGGLIATALDECQGTLMWLLRRPAVTARLEIDYLTPVPLGSELALSGWAVAVADRKVYTVAEARFVVPARESGESGALGELAVRSAGLFVIVTSERLQGFQDAGVGAVVSP